jgi:UPF0755 protein
VKKLVLISIIGIFLFSVGGTALFLWDFVNRGASKVSQEIVLEVKPGSTLRSISKDLKRLNLVRNAELFVLLGRVQGGATKLKAGEYALDQTMNPLEILNVLKSGKSIEYNLTVMEGLSIFEIAEIFEKSGLCAQEDFLKTVADPEYAKSLTGEEIETLEGFLFPSTYSYTKFTDYKDIIKKMVSSFQDAYREAISQSKISGLNKKQIVTLASIIEKETGAPSDRPLVSSVFHNRLKKNMMLQTDPTIIYGKAKETGKIELSITKADILRPTPYNTYTIKGLPPGPIANPGKASLLAAVQPAQTPYLFFVSRNDGTTHFSETLESHNSAVKKFQLDPKAREGKSWRDLDKGNSGK